MEDPQLILAWGISIKICLEFSCNIEESINFEMGFLCFILTFNAYKSRITPLTFFGQIWLKLNKIKCKARTCKNSAYTYNCTVCAIAAYWREHKREWNDSQWPTRRIDVWCERCSRCYHDLVQYFSKCAFVSCGTMFCLVCGEEKKLYRWRSSQRQL